MDSNINNELNNEQVDSQVNTQIDNITNDDQHMRTRDKSNVIAWGLGALIIVGSVLKWTGFFGNATISEICTVGATCWTLCCAPISLNVTLEKFLNKVN